MTFDTGYTCYIERIGTVCIKLLDGVIRELKDVRYVPQLNKNLISVKVLEAHGLRGTLGEGVLKMSNGSLVVLKGIRYNLYYLKDIAVTESLTASEHLKDDSIMFWQTRLGQIGLNSLEAFAK